MLRSKINFYSFLVLVSATSCATSNQWIQDDVYSTRSAIVPLETDVNDETDYNAFVYKKSKEEKAEIYVDQYNIDRSWNNRPIYVGIYSYRNNPDYCGCENRSFAYSASYFHDDYFRALYGCNDFYGYNSGYANNSFFYNPYYGNGYYGNSYGYPHYGNSYGYYYGNGYFGNGYGNSYYSNGNTSNGYSNSNTLNKNGLGGPRGSIGGFGGVSSRQANTLKSTPATGRAGKESSASASSININGNVGGRNSTYNSNRSSSPSVARPSSTTSRSEGYSSGSTTRTNRPEISIDSPSRGGSNNTISSPRSGGSSDGNSRSNGSAPTRSSGNVNKVGRP